MKKPLGWKQSRVLYSKEEHFYIIGKDRNTTESWFQLTRSRFLSSMLEGMWYQSGRYQDCRTIKRRLRGFMKLVYCILNILEARQKLMRFSGIRIHTTVMRKLLTIPFGKITWAIFIRSKITLRFNVWVLLLNITRSVNRKFLTKFSLQLLVMR